VTARPPILAAIDRYGADIAAWPDRALAFAAREAAVADPEVRRRLELARGLSTGLELARAAVDDEIDRSGAAARVAGRLLASLPGGRLGRTAWIAIAATLVLAACLGAMVEISRSNTASERALDVVVLDPLVFGPTEADQP
jgi:hypothetical protein